MSLCTRPDCKEVRDATSRYCPTHKEKFGWWEEKQRQSAALIGEYGPCPDHPWYASVMCIACDQILEREEDLMALQEDQEEDE